jgi:hypothetical protein
MPDGRRTTFYIPTKTQAFSTRIYVRGPHEILKRNKQD